ncbi:MAG: hypothetical protein ACLFVH_13195 [Phycisphaerae bacterium]
MLSHPRIGQRVQVWYAVKPRRKGGIAKADLMPLHGQFGVVRVVATGPGPRNHGVEIGGELYVVPRGNLRRPPAVEVDESELPY